MKKDGGSEIIAAISGLTDHLARLFKRTRIVRPGAYNPSMLQTIAWTGSAARLLDQTRLPTETVYVDITDEKQMWDAIKRLVVRGATAIGVAAAFGVYLGVRHCTNLTGFKAKLAEACDYLATSRPTAVNLFWAIDRVRRVAADQSTPLRSVAGFQTTHSR